MVVTAATLKKMDEFSTVDETVLTSKLKAVEGLIRSYTSNNFQNRNMRIEAPVSGGVLLGRSPYFKVGDTLQISQSGVNDGLYVISAITDTTITVGSDLYDNALNTVTKVVYPVDVQKGVIDLMAWEQENRSKVGIQSETISRHSVTYFNQDSSNQVMGYPVSLLGFLKPYIKARF